MKNSDDKSDNVRLKTKTLSLRSNASTPKTPRTGPKKLKTAVERNQSQKRSALTVSSDEGI